VASAGSYRAIGVAMAVVGVVCFSLRPILIKLAYGIVVDPITLLALRMIFSLPFFLAAAAWVGREGGRAPIGGRSGDHHLFRLVGAGRDHDPGTIGRRRAGVGGRGAGDAETLKIGRNS